MRQIVVPLLSFLSFLAAPAGVSAINFEETNALTERRSEEADPAMDTEGVDRGLANVLKNFYLRSFGGSEAWEEISSLRIKGRLLIDDQELPFISFHKKPNLVKTRIGISSENVLIYAYDGRKVWVENEQTGTASAMEPADARNFIRTAQTGSVLLYPKYPGKTIELEGTIEKDGERYYKLITTLPDGQSLTSYVHTVTYEERYFEATDHVNGHRELTVYSDFRVQEGFRFPFKNELFVEGEYHHTVIIDDLRTNVGMTPWFFVQPAEDVNL